MLTDLQLKRYWCYRKKQFKPEQAKAFSIMQTEWYELGGYETNRPGPYDNCEEDSSVRIVIDYDDWGHNAEKDWLDESNYPNKRAFEQYKKYIQRMEQEEGYFFIAAEYRNPATNEWEWSGEALHGILGEDAVKEYADEFKGYAIDAYKKKYEEVSLV